MKNLLTILGLSVLTSCASQVDWRKEHYKVANQGARCMQMINTGQTVSAKKLGCTNIRQNQPNASSHSTSNGNISNIYVNGSNRQPAAQNRPDAQQQFYNIFNNIYQQERADRIHRDKVYNSGL